VYRSYHEWGTVAAAVFQFAPLGHPWVEWFVPLSMWVAVGLTLLSGVLYLWRNRQLYLQDL